MPWAGSACWVGVKVGGLFTGLVGICSVVMKPVKGTLRMTVEVDILRLPQLSFKETQHDHCNLITLPRTSASYFWMEHKRQIKVRVGGNRKHSKHCYFSKALQPHPNNKSYHWSPAFPCSHRGRDGGSECASQPCSHRGRECVR